MVPPDKSLIIYFLPVFHAVLSCLSKGVLKSVSQTSIKWTTIIIVHLKELDVSYICVDSEDDRDITVKVEPAMTCVVDM